MSYSDNADVADVSSLSVASLNEGGNALQAESSTIPGSEQKEIQDKETQRIKESAQDVLPTFVLSGALDAPTCGGTASYEDVGRKDLLQLFLKNQDRLDKNHDGFV